MLRNHNEWNSMMRHEREYLENFRRSLEKNRHDREDAAENDEKEESKTTKCSAHKGRKLPLKKGGRDAY